MTISIGNHRQVALAGARKKYNLALREVDRINKLLEENSSVLLEKKLIQAKDVLSRWEQKVSELRGK